MSPVKQSMDSAKWLKRLKRLKFSRFYDDHNWIDSHWVIFEKLSDYSDGAVEISADWWTEI